MKSNYYDTDSERRAALYNNPASEKRRADEGKPVSKVGNLRLRQHDEKAEMGQRQSREDRALHDRHRFERDSHAVTSRAVPSEMLERHKRETERLTKKHGDERAAMERRHTTERKKVANGH